VVSLSDAAKLDLYHARNLYVRTVDANVQAPEDLPTFDELDDDQQRWLVEIAGLQQLVKEIS
jgi:hypothetical protein